LVSGFMLVPLVLM